MYAVTASEQQADGRLAAALADNGQLKARLAEKDQQLAEKDRQIAHLTKMLFARKSERLADEKHPLLPFPDDETAPPPPPHVDEAADDEFEEVTYQRKKRGATRISKDLPREVRTITLPELDDNSNPYPFRGRYAFDQPPEPRVNTLRFECPLEIGFEVLRQAGWRVNLL